MIDYLVHEKSVMGDDDEASGEFKKEFLEDREGDKVEIVSWFIENQEIGVFDKDREQVQTSFFTATERACKCLLLLRGKQEAFEKLRCSEFLSFCDKNIFGNIANDINNSLVSIVVCLCLLIVSHVDSLSLLDISAVCRLISCKDIHKCRFSDAIFPDDTNTFSMSEIVREIFQDQLLTKGFLQMMDLEDLISHTPRLYLKCEFFTFLEENILTCFKGIFQFSKFLYSIDRFGSSCSRRFANPLKFVSP